MIEIRNFSKYYGNTRILHNINLQVPRGKTLVIIGKSGCGKSTLLRHIAGLENAETGPIEGEIVLGGQFVITKMTEKEIVEKKLRGSFVGMVFQSAALFDFLNVRENLEWPMEENCPYTAKERLKRAVEALEMVELSKDFLERDVQTLSGGEKRRVALARALVLEPQILLYDEPTTGLDPPTAFEINRLINRLKEKRQITSVVTTHDMWSAKMVADEIAMIQKGEVVFRGSYQQALEHPEVCQFIEGGRVS